MTTLRRSCASHVAVWSRLPWVSGMRVAEREFVVTTGVLVAAALLLLASVPTQAQTPQTQWISPISAQASGETPWAWYTGPASFAIDNDPLTAWTYRGLGTITFDLGVERDISAISVTWGGSVTSGNVANVYIDSVLVVDRAVLGAWSNVIQFPAIRGRVIAYETLPLPHNQYGQVATWSEVGEFRVQIGFTPSPCTPFADIDASDPFCASTVWLKNRAITLGCTSNEYCPSAFVTRLQMAGFLSRMAPMLLPVMYDAANRVIGHYFYGQGATSTTPQPYLALSKASDVYYFPLVEANSATGTVFEIRSGDVYFEYANCSDAGKKWIAPNQRYPFQRNWGLVGPGLSGPRLFTTLGMVPGPVSAMSVRRFADGACAQHSGTVPVLGNSGVWEVKDLREATTITPPLTLR